MNVKGKVAGFTGWRGDGTYLVGHPPIQVSTNALAVGQRDGLMSAVGGSNTRACVNVGTVVLYKSKSEDKVLFYVQ